MKAGKGQARVLKVIDDAKKVVGYVTHGTVLEALARVVEIDLATQDGALPALVSCIDCGMKRQRKGPTLPKRCKECARKEELRLQRERTARAGEAEGFKEKKKARWAANADKTREQRKALRKANPEKVKQQNRAAYIKRKEAARRGES